MIAPPAHQQREPPVLLTFPSPFQAHSSPPTSVPARRAQASSFIKMKSIKVSGKEERTKSLWGNKSRLPSVVNEEFIPDCALENRECRQDGAARAWWWVCWSRDTAQSPGHHSWVPCCVGERWPSVAELGLEPRMESQPALICLPKVNEDSSLSPKLNMRTKGTRPLSVFIIHTFIHFYCAPTVRQARSLSTPQCVEGARAEGDRGPVRSSLSPRQTMPQPVFTVERETVPPW